MKLSDWTGLLLCSLRRHDWHPVTTGHGARGVLEVCARRGCRGRTSRLRGAS